MPTANRLNPRLPGLCSNREESAVAGSGTNAKLSDHARECNESKKPGQTPSNKEGSRSRHPTPKVKNAKPGWLKLCRKGVGPRCKRSKVNAKRPNQAQL